MPLPLEDLKLIDRIAERAAVLYLRFDIEVKPIFIAAEIAFVHGKVQPLRLKEMLEADDENFSHDIGGIHRHLNMRTKSLDDCFMPRFAHVA